MKKIDWNKVISWLVILALTIVSFAAVSFACAIAVNIFNTFSGL